MKLGEIARAKGFNSLGDMVNSGLKQIKELEKNSFNVGQIVRLKDNYTPTHFNEEKVLPSNTDFEITEKTDGGLGNFFIKIKGYEIWFSVSVFELT
jgi:hypothetical protein